MQDANHDDLHLEMPTFPSNNFQLLKSLIFMTQQMRQPHLCYNPKRPNHNPKSQHNLRYYINLVGKKDVTRRLFFEMEQFSQSNKITKI